MNIDDLMLALQSNAERAAKPVAVEVDGVGTVHVRGRTVAEFEAMAAVTKTDGEAGLFAQGLERLICNEDGKRYPAEYRSRLIALLEKQPDGLFQKLIAAADGTEKKAAAEGN